MSYKEFATENMRLRVLELLSEDRAGSINERLLQMALAEYSFNLNDTEMREALQFLEKELAIKIERIGDDVMWVAHLKRRGEQHLARQEIIDGIARPSLG